MSESQFEISLKSGIHKKLGALAGNWEGATKTWFEPNVLADESPMKGRIRPILEGRFLIYEYQGSLNGNSFEGVATFGFDIANNKIQCSWIDSFHMGTGILLSEGNMTDHGFSVLGSYGGPDIPEPWGWRTVFELTDENNLIITAYNISPEGQEDKATETIYKRVS
ncbi:DUF1579 domain-containing protein [Dyadobacter sp. LHD-138]|uniref:DUF1579 domain-containing protein n=1 Tax=Dyadobacter sp. LHD-138 TaxID=3071413 RepID=UPI0027E13841|nr:DUF1579 domain-containing protein [Dyadobacter sp. LHD-138]MDQ6482451.1 DUF1579 domain-containing protein [Dyadobacter sp. LHD-138]